MTGIVDYGMGNLLSVFSAFEYIGEPVKIISRPEDLSVTDRIVIPGVGAFEDCIRRLSSSGFTAELNDHVLRQAKPTLGICLGMQVMGTRSLENGEFEGLNWFNSDVIRLHPPDDMRVPNIGWNETKFRSELPLFKSLPAKVDFYFVHSYYMDCKEATNVAATYEYGHQVTAAVIKDNIFATQFHPEKSQDYGLKILENFINWRP